MRKARRRKYRRVLSDILRSTVWGIAWFNSQLIYPRELPLGLGLTI